MKKYSVKFILLEIAVMVFTGALPAVIFRLVSSRPDLTIVVLALTMGIAAILPDALANKVLFPLAKRTMDKNLQLEGFESTRVFHNKESHSCGSILVIDEKRKVIAYVSVHNPFSFQTALAKELTGVKSAFIEGPFSGTRYVYYEFTYNGKRTRIPTFTSRNMHFLSSSSVKKAIAKADRFRDSVLKMQGEEKASLTYVPDYEKRAW